MDEAKFQKAVEITRDYMQSLAPLMGGPTPRLYALFYWLIPFCESHFNRDVPSQEEYLRLLIYCSKEITAAWEGLNLIAQEMVRNGEHPPPELAKWTAEQRPRPTKRGPDPLRGRESKPDHRHHDRAPSPRKRNEGDSKRAYRSNPKTRIMPRRRLGLRCCRRGDGFKL